MNCNFTIYLLILVSYLVMKGPQWKYDYEIDLFGHIIKKNTIKDISNKI